MPSTASARITHFRKEDRLFEAAGRLRAGFPPTGDAHGRPEETDFIISIDLITDRVLPPAEISFAG